MSERGGPCPARPPGLSAGPAADHGRHNSAGERRLSQTDETSPPTPMQGPFTLEGPVTRPDPRAVPLRGDLAHIGLAGRYFVPHYAVPQPRAVMPGGAALKAEPHAEAEELCRLAEGDSFEVLDVTGAWVWGCVSLSGPVGYVHKDRIEPVPG